MTSFSFLVKLLMPLKKVEIVIKRMCPIFQSWKNLSNGHDNHVFYHMEASSLFNSDELRLENKGNFSSNVVVEL